jgi:hypothetical protein
LFVTFTVLVLEPSWLAGSASVRFANARHAAFVTGVTLVVMVKEVSWFASSSGKELVLFITLTVLVLVPSWFARGASVRFANARDAAIITGVTLVVVV